ncbi:glucokinase [Ophiostoma piceae UAMH 11346]|uniref:Phosphotransferase n=1 Tax=Ophiostoma piceae (strain UAMH 11346) TaxID=1262450 RepID=S3D1N4_OPHP1|nr:glucokinase [Ophiostoma piceae UAMH 11346]
MTRHASNRSYPDSSRPLHAAVAKIIDQFTLPTADLKKITDHFLAELRRGLLDPGLPFQLPAFVTTIPTGEECGKFLSVDLGGTNCRICLVHLQGNGEFSVTQSKHAVPQDVMVNEQFEPLFSWLAARIGDFVAEHIQSSSGGGITSTASETRTPLGFTFSFTCDQTSLSDGTLIHWDKGWDIPAAIGRDPCRLLQNSIDAAGVQVEVVALANDSVGTLLARAYTAASINNGTPSRTLASIIVGTGTNAAYIEQLSRIERYSQPPQIGSGKKDGLAVMVMNSEWGCWDDALAVLPQTHFDADIDTSSSNPGGQMFEKMASGMYLGELFRLAVHELVQSGDVFDFEAAGDSTPLVQRDALDTSLLSALAQNNTSIIDSKELVSSRLAVDGVSDRDVYALKAIAGSITARAARLTGAALAAILIQCGYGVNTQKIQDAAVVGEAMAIAACPEATEAPLTDSKKKSWLITSTAKVFGAIASCARDLLSCCFPVTAGDRRDSSQCAKRSRETSTSMSREAASIGGHLEDATEIIDVGITGSVIELHPTFETEMLEAIGEIPAIALDNRRKLRTGLCRDGSAVGAALMAHAALCQK